MTTGTVQRPEATYDEWNGRHWRLTGAAVALLFLATVAATVLAGSWRGGLSNLDAAVADGSVGTVEVAGLPPAGEVRDTTVVTISWEGGIVDRWTEVRFDRLPGPAEDGSAPADRVVGADPLAYLESAYPDVTVQRAPLGAAHGELLGWRVPEVVAGAALLSWGAAILLVIGGPQPWRATRWAWGWLLLMGGPLGATAYVLLGGPLGLWRPDDLRRRLTGGWAFVLALVLFSGLRSS